MRFKKYNLSRLNFALRPIVQQFHFYHAFQVWRKKVVAQGGQQNLRNRVASVFRDEDNDGNYDNAIHYSYDVHGNAQTVIRDVPALFPLGKHLNKMTYTYDLISGNVLTMTSLSGQTGQLTHRYSYDADNRLRAVYTSSDGYIWTRDAKQLYNSIGTMARLELGQYQVQGLDYIYTINGWLKTINSVTLKTDRDPGHDGPNRLYAGSNNPHACFAEDAFGFALTYFKQKPDEVVICNSTYSGDNASFEPLIANGSPYGSAVYDLFNGNIAAWSNGMYKADETPMDFGSYVFRYDKLNRIKSANVWYDATIGGSNEWSTSASEINAYHTEYSYDYNGNMLTLLRKGQTGNLNMDDLNYGYITNGQNYPATRRRTNMLLGYNDAVGSGAYTNTDIDDPGLGTFSETNSSTWNFIYDEVGNLIRDKAEEIESIEWNVYGKVKKVTRFSANPASNKPDLEFVYDPMGNRICKIEKPRTAGVLSTQEDWKYTWYSLDAQGQTMAAYEQTYTDQGSGNYVTNFDHQETYIYGSSRIGVVNDEQGEVESTRGFTASIDANTGKFINVVWATIQNQTICTQYCVYSYTCTVGMRQYEISNHLGNVQTTISDRRIAVPSGSNLDHYIADVLSSTDYYPFGSPMPGRNSNSADYRFGFNGQEMDNEITGQAGTHTTAMFWEYDSRLGRRWNLDPKPQTSISYYACFANNPIAFSDINGDKIKYENRDIKKAFRNEMKQRGIWKDVKKEYRGNKKDLNVLISDKTRATLSKAQIQKEYLNSKKDYVQNQDWFIYREKPMVIEHIDLMPIRPNTPIFDDQPLELLPIELSQPSPDPVNISVTEPFNGGYETFINQTRADGQIRAIANAFLNTPNASKIIIIIGTTARNLNQPSSNPDGRTINQLLIDRAIMIQRQLIRNGVPIEAFQKDWYQPAPGTTVSTTITIR